MPRYVVMFEPEGAPASDLALIEGSPGVTILDRTSMAWLIETSEEAARALAERLPDCTVTPETSHPPPRPPRPSPGA